MNQDVLEQTSPESHFVVLFIYFSLSAVGGAHSVLFPCAALTCFCAVTFRYFVYQCCKLVHTCFILIHFNTII